MQTSHHTKSLLVLSFALTVCCLAGCMTEDSETTDSELVETNSALTSNEEPSNDEPLEHAGAVREEGRNYQPTRQRYQPGRKACVMAMPMVSDSKIEQLFAVVVDGECAGLSGPGYIGDLAGMSWVEFNDLGLGLDATPRDRLYTAAMNGDELEMFEDAIHTEGLGDFFFTLIGLGSGGTEPQGCANCAVDNCTGYGGNEWFDCVCSHCWAQCHTAYCGGGSQH